MSAISLQTAPAQPCQNGSVRLVNGNIEQEGRVEVCIGGIWGSMCASSWSNPSANGFVVCNQLGFRGLSRETIKIIIIASSLLLICIFFQIHYCLTFPDLVLAVDQYLEALNVRAGSRILVNASVETVSTIQLEMIAATQTTLLECNAEIVSVLCTVQCYLL